ncbi:MAG: hypothetical protein IJW60_04185 [Clostridia bacterium]|nr:hypothetical protein [Clostridia bacterium]
MEHQTEKLKIEDVLREKGVYIGPTVGVSMLPMLKNRRDTIVVKPKIERLKRLDVALYKRGEAYVLHRVLEAVDGGYIIRGDNCYADENVPEEAVIGVLTEFFRKDKHYYCTDKKYIRYAKRRIRTYKLRRFYLRVKGGIFAFGGKILRALRLKK